MRCPGGSNRWEGGAMTNPDADDALSGLAPLLRVRPELTDFCRFGGAWASSHRAEPAGWAYFHIVTKGSGLLDRDGLGPRRLVAGDTGPRVPQGNGRGAVGVPDRSAPRFGPAAPRQRRRVDGPDRGGG